MAAQFIQFDDNQIINLENITGFGYAVGPKTTTIYIVNTTGVPNLVYADPNRNIWEFCRRVLSSQLQDVRNT